MKLLPTAASASTKLSVLTIVAICVQLVAVIQIDMGEQLYVPMLAVASALFAGALVTGARGWRKSDVKHRIVIKKLLIVAGLAVALSLLLAAAASVLLSHVTDFTDVEL